MVDTPEGPGQPDAPFDGGGPPPEQEVQQGLTGVVPEEV